MKPPSEEEATPQSPPPPAAVGARLTAAREKWGLSVDEVAQCLNLSVDAIQALEQDAYQRLPGAAFAMGYLRAYAKLLKLDQTEIIASANLETEQKHKIPYAKEPLKHPHRARPMRGGSFILSTLLIVVVLVGLVAVTQLPGFSVSKLLQAVGLSTQTDREGKFLEVPLPNSANSKGSTLGSTLDSTLDSTFKIE